MILTVVICIPMFVGLGLIIRTALYADRPDTGLANLVLGLLGIFLVAGSTAIAVFLVPEVLLSIFAPATIAAALLAIPIVMLAPIVDDIAYGIDYIATKYVPSAIFNALTKLETILPSWLPAKMASLGLITLVGLIVNLGLFLLLPPISPIWMTVIILATSLPLAAIGRVHYCKTDPQVSQSPRDTSPLEINSPRDHFPDETNSSSSGPLNIQPAARIFSLDEDETDKHSSGPKNRFSPASS